MPDLKEIIKHYPEITGVHPACLAVSQLDSSDYAVLKSNIAMHGLSRAIVLSESGELIDGRHRLMACYEAKIEPIFEATTLDPWEVAFRENFARGQRSATDRCKFGEAWKAVEQAAAKQRQGKRNDLNTSAKAFAEVQRASDKIGERVGVSGRTFEKYETVLQFGDPETVSQMNENTISIDAAYKRAAAAKKLMQNINEKRTPLTNSMTTIVTAAGKKSKIAQPAKVVFNQTNDSVDWARWTWNPVTGCEHGCRFCYAREIANSDRMADYYPNKFEPTFHEYRLEAPRNTKRPESKDERDGRVFVCSMADLFGKWVPDEWIRKVFDACLDAKDWQYMFLTKWPARYSKMPLIPRAWYGASIIQQADVSRVTSAMRRIEGEVTRWVSLEPMLGPIEFDGLEWCDLVVIGSQTSTNQPDGFVPAFSPKFEWVADVVRQCRAEHVPVYLKANLSSNPGMEMPKERPRESV